MAVAVMRRFESGFAASFDRALYSALLTRSRSSLKRSRAESLAPDERILALRELAARYGSDELLLDPNRVFFSEPPVPAIQLRRRGSFGSEGDVLSLRWASNFELWCRDPDLGARYGKHRNNEYAYARLHAHRDRPRPTLILIHGYLGGHFGVEAKMWPLSWLFQHGLDVALAVLPFHGLRGRRWPVDRPPLPHTDPRFTIEGFRQAMWDLRSLIRWLESRGAQRVGVMGMSLGGYTSALLATVEEKLAFAVPHIPLASIADFARDGQRFTGTPEQQAEQHRLLDRVYRVVSPLARPPKVGPEGRLVIGGDSDRIVPLAHAKRIATHFGAPLEVFHGGHLLQFGRERSFAAFAELVARSVSECG